MCTRQRKYTMRLIALLSLLIAVSTADTLAQDTSELMTPARFLGYELGERFTRHERVLDYVRHVAEASERVNQESYGETYEHRELVLATISTPANLARIESIRTDNLKRANLLDGNPDGPPVAIVWLSYNVHGNESVSSEAAMQTLYELADAGNPRTGGWLENTVVILDPMINPDGRDRYVNWYNQMVGAEPDMDGDGAEHHEPWVSGRTNHYFFDLNRDWSWLTQQETRARIAQYNRWMPHVHVDFHEQGVNNPYYFAPASPPYHAAITDWQLAFQETIGRNHARYFDANGWLYFTKQVFDLFYPGYGDTFPTFNGAVGMTYEQGGSGYAGLGVKTAEGDTLTLSTRIAGHYTTGMSTVETASDHATELVEQFGAYFDRAMTVPDGEAAAYVLRSPSGQGRLTALAAHLNKLGIQYGSPAEGVRLRGHDYRQNGPGTVTTQSGDLVVPRAQPRGTLVRVLFEPESHIPDSLTYDITAWALPYAYDLDAWAVSAAPELRAWSGETAHAPADVRSGQPAYAYLFAWDDADDAVLLSHLYRTGLRVRAIQEPVTVGGHTFPRGSLVVTRRGNEQFGARFDDEVRAVAAMHDGTAFPVMSGYVDAGPDLGSSDVVYLKPPRVGMLFGSPARTSSVGQTWHLFDETWQYPLTRIPTENLARVDLDDYDVLILPSGSYGSILNDAGMDRLRGWVRGGGRLVALDRAASWLVGKDGFSLKAPEKADPADSTQTRVELEERYADRERARTPRSNPGAVFSIDVDPTHPLAYGFGPSTWLLRLQSDGPPVMIGSSAWNTGTIGGRVSGHVGYEAEAKMPETLSFGSESMGSGTVVYLLDDPIYRGFWYAGRLLMANAIFQVGQ